MWNTPIGNRVLRGAEAELFKHAIGSLLEEMNQNAEIDQEHSVGISLFDELKRPQKLQLMESVAVALLDRKMPAPAANALTDAVVGAVYEQLRINLEIELDEDGERDEPDEEKASGKKNKKVDDVLKGFESNDFRYWWRRVLLDGLARMEWDDSLPDEKEEDSGAWYRLVWRLRDRVLRRRAWDNDRTLARMRALRTLRIGGIPSYFEMEPPDLLVVPTESVEYFLKRLDRSLGKEFDQAVRRRPVKKSKAGKAE